MTMTNRQSTFDIELATAMGMCTGLRRILARTKSELRHGPLSVFGEFVHNPKVYDSLAAAGADRIDHVNEVEPGARVVIGPHGNRADIKASVSDVGATLIDTSCPRVMRVVDAGIAAHRAGRTVVFVGREGHEEAEMLRATVGTVYVVDRLEDVDALPRGPLGLVAQSTLTESRYSEVVDSIAATCRSFVVEDTICPETIARQQSALLLANGVDLLVVVGSQRSHNTVALAATCATVTRVVLVNGADELDASWFREVRRVGVTAGASTPDDVVDEVLDCLRQLRASDA
jgi:4-hydroxy-3-methylbut-2-enyl diphosphate reductase